jgi:transcriptional regulator of acetoin/glycerol metabolism
VAQGALDLLQKQRGAGEKGTVKAGNAGAAAKATSLKEAVRKAERRALMQAWTESGGNVSQASRLLGVSRPTLYKLLRDHGLR